MNELASYTMRLITPADRQETAVLIEPVGREEERFGLQECWGVLRNRFRLIAVFFFCTVLATVLVILLVPPTYTAEVTLLIERQTPRVLEIREISTEPLLPDEYDFYKTQYELLKSRALAAQVIRELGLNPKQFTAGESDRLPDGVPTLRR